MRIEKFNESYRGDKIIKLYNDNILHNYYQDKDEYDKMINEKELILKNKKIEILKLINEYIEINKNYFKSKYFFHYDVINFNFYIDEDSKTPKLSLDPKYSERVWLKYDDIEGLLKFLNNPDLYKDTKKYNL